MPSMLKLVCEQCGIEFERRLAEVTRSRKRGYSVFCSTDCHDLSQAPTLVQLTCAFCLKPFERPKWKTQSEIKYCSRNCQWASYRYTTEQFIARAHEVHGDRYDYGAASYAKKRLKVTIICRVPGHGAFPQTPERHLGGQGCPQCAEQKTLPNLDHAYTKVTRTIAMNRPETRRKLARLVWHNLVTLVRTSVHRILNAYFVGRLSRREIAAKSERELGWLSAKHPDKGTISVPVSAELVGQVCRGYARRGVRRYWMPWVETWKRNHRSTMESWARDHQQLTEEQVRSILELRLVDGVVIATIAKYLGVSYNVTQMVIHGNKSRMAAYWLAWKGRWMREHPQAIADARAKRVARRAEDRQARIRELLVGLEPHNRGRIPPSAPIEISR